MKLKTPIPRLRLNDGYTLPMVTFGTGTAFYQQPCKDGVLTAIRSGFKSFDVAQDHLNSEDVGQAIKEWGGNRDDLYITTKFGRPTRGNGEETEPRRALKDELDKLGVSHVDMYLIHHPNFHLSDRPLSEVWKTMEDLKNEGLTKSIGVGNFKRQNLVELEQTWTVPPAVNQIKYHPYWYHMPEMLATTDFCRDNKILIQAWGAQTPLTNPGPVDPVLQHIAEKKGVTAGQVLLAWAAQKSEGGVVTTSRREHRLKEAIDVFTQITRLTESELEEISQAGKAKSFSNNKRGDRGLDSFH